MALIIQVLTILSNSQLTNLIQSWTNCKISSTIAQSLIVVLSVILFSICVFVPSPHHFFKKLFLSVCVFFVCSFLLCATSQIRFVDSEKVTAYQKIQANHQLDKEIPTERQQMTNDNDYVNSINKHKHLSLVQTMAKKHYVRNYKHTDKILKEREQFNRKNNHSVYPKVTNYL